MRLPDLEQVPPKYHALLVEAIERSYRSYPFFCRFWLGFDPHEKQREFARPAQLVVQSCGSGFGKSVGGSSFMLWEAWRHERHAYGVFAPTNRQVKFILEDITDHILNGGSKFALFIDHKPTQEDPYLGLTNGSKLWFLNTAYGAENNRGIELNGAWMDEAAMDNDDTYRLVTTRARLSPGWIRLTSTPKGKVGFFFEQAQIASEEMIRAEAEKRTPTMRLIKAASEDRPSYDRSILAQRKASLPDRYWQQEYMGEFVDMEGGTFRQRDLDRVFDRTWEPEKSPRVDGLYVHGWDFGRKTTYTVGTTLAYDRLEDVAGEVRGVDQEDHLGERWTTIFERVNAREARWADGSSMSDTILDATGIGDVIDQSIDISAHPFIFTQKSRGELILRLTQAVEQDGRLRLPRSWTKLYASMQLHTAKEDAPGQTWDHLDSLGLAYWLAFERTNFGTPFVRLG